MSGSGLILFGVVMLILGGQLAYWFEDVLRGPIMRVYDDYLRRERPILTPDEED